jgi:hypothetical protein
MKIKDIFKGAATAAIAFGASRLLPEQIAKPVGTALSKALFSPSGSGGGYGSASEAFVPKRVNLSQFSMGTYAAGSARSDPMKQITTDPERILSEWDYRLTQYARRAYIQKRIAASAKV